MLYVSFVTQNTMVAFIFRFDPWKYQYKVKFAKKSSKNMSILSSFVSGFQKCCLFLCTTIRNAKKMHFKYVTSSPLRVFFCHCAGKNKDISLKFCMRVVCMYLDHMYSGLLDNSKISDFIGNYF